MRRKYFSIAIAALATVGPMQAWGGDREIAEQIIKRLKVNRDSGALKDFTLDMKVDDGVVLFRGNVAEDVQRELVLSAAKGIDGIAKVVNEVSVNGAMAKAEPAEKPELMVAEAKSPIAAPPVAAKLVKPATPLIAASAENLVTEEPAVVPAAEDFSLRQALANQAKIARETSPEPMAVVPGVVQPASAVEEASQDDSIISSVVSALGRAKNEGQLKGFGVDVKCNDGVLRLTGRAASEEQRNTILRICQRVPGVAGVREAISIPALTQLPAPVMQMEAPAQQRSQGVPAQLASAPLADPIPVAQPAPAPMMAAPYQAAPQMGTQMGTPAMSAGFHGQMGSAPMMGQPVPMAPHSAVGAPRYDSPNLPNYAWPGYAAHPNYAAVTYPQQYSPSAWPYIGPFYPYPQVPLGWRKVSLEWDDGWWFLDFTDR